MRGEVTFFSRGDGYGIIKGDDGREYYVRACNVHHLRDLNPGLRVEFRLDRSGGHGRPGATDIQLLPDAAAS
jgi:cold shock CspA family protein